jgi:hypothetical protein
MVSVSALPRRRRRARCGGLASRAISATFAGGRRPAERAAPTPHDLASDATNQCRSTAPVERGRGRAEGSTRTSPGPCRRRYLGSGGWLVGHGNTRVGCAQPALAWRRRALSPSPCWISVPQGSQGIVWRRMLRDDVGSQLRARSCCGRRNGGARARVGTGDAPPGPMRRWADRPRRRHPRPAAGIARDRAGTARDHATSPYRRRCRRCSRQAIRGTRPSWSRSASR